MELFEDGKIAWSKHFGYECSSKGDKRFSAFYAKLEDGRTIEEWYQCDVKGYDTGGTNWRLGKGNPPLGQVTAKQLWESYLQLWQRWAKLHPIEMAELRAQAKPYDNMLSDTFATSDINQAHALATILNDSLRS